MIRDEHYRSKLPHRARGHAELVALVGGVFAEIDERLDRRNVVRVLDLGCGYGTVLLELRQRYGSKVDLHGLNLRPEDGDVDILVRNGIERGLVAPGAHRGVALPALHYADVADGLPFDDDTFDLVYSQVAWLYFGNKVGVLREVSRVLREDGLAKIDADELRPGLPPEYRRLVEIWHAGRLIPLGDYVRSSGMRFVQAAEGEYLHFGKMRRFAEDLELLFQTDLCTIHPDWDGIKCVYRVTAAAA